MEKLNSNRPEMSPVLEGAVQASEGGKTSMHLPGYSTNWPGKDVPTILIVS